MNTFKTLALGVVLAGFGIADAAAAVPAGPVFATFVSDKGLRAKESERYAQVYVKSSNVGDTVFFQFGEGAKIDTLVLTKANTLVNIKKTGLEGAGTVVKIWAPQTVWFLNINNNDATSFTPAPAPPASGNSVAKTIRSTTWISCPRCRLSNIWCRQTTGA